MARVLISGYYGFGNLGDEALLSGLVTGLTAQGHVVTVLSNNPAATQTLHGVAAVHRYRRLFPALLRHDALISGGGGLLQDKTSARSLQYYLGVLRLAKAFGKRTFVYGQSVGPLSEEGKRATARALRGVQLAVRDEASRGLLESLGLESTLVADAALLLPHHPTPIAPTAPVLLVPRGGYPAITASLTELAQRLQAEGIPVAALAFQGDEDDAPIADIKAAVPELMVWQAATPQEALSLVASSSYVVSGRLHALILAAVAERPFSGLVYDPKVAAFLQEAGVTQHPLEADPELLMKEIQQPHLSLACIARLKRRAQEGLGWLCSGLS